MKKYRTLLYHSKRGDGHIIDNAIAIVTQLAHMGLILDPVLWDVVKLGLSHEEIWTPDEEGEFDVRECKYCGFQRCYPEECAGGFDRDYIGTCYTSTMGQVRGSNNVGDGTCKRRASKVLKHPKRWSYTEHEVSDDAYAMMLQYLEVQVDQNKGYGLGKGKNICSVLSNNANITSGELAGPYRFISPLGSALHLVRSGKEIIPLKG